MLLVDMILFRIIVFYLNINIIGFQLNWKIRDQDFFCKFKKILNNNNNLFDWTFICSNFLSVMNFVVFDTNKFDEKSQSFVSAIEKKSEFFDLHCKFLKSSNATATFFGSITLSDSMNF